MKKINRYIAESMISSTGIMILIFVGLGVLLTFVAQMRDIGHGDFSVLQAFIYTLFYIPEQLYQFFPMAALLGSLLGLSALSSKSELIAMRASGVSSIQIIWAVIRIALLLTLFVTILGEVIAPYASHHAEMRKKMAESGGQALQTGNGVWVKSDNRYIYIKQIESKVKMKGIITYAFTPTMQLKKTRYAKSAIKENGQWMLHDVQETQLNDAKNISKTYDSLPWIIRIDPSILGKTLLDPIQMSLPSLHHYIDYRHHIGLGAKRYQLAFWQRIFQVFTTSVMMFLAVPFVFGTLRQSSIGFKMLIGVFVGFGFFTLNQFFGPVAIVYQLPPILAAVLPVILCFLLGCFAFRRVH